MTDFSEHLDNSDKGYRTMPVLQKVNSTKPSDVLHVVAVISNPVGYGSRFRLYKQFEQHMLQYNVNLVTVELALGDKNHEVTDAANPNHIQLRTLDEIWHKENMINIGISRLPADWQYVAWIDADIQFTNPNWVEQTLMQLQHHHIVQLFQNAIDLGPTGEFLQKHTGFGYMFVNGKMPNDPEYGSFAHPGFGWAMTREAFDIMGPMIDFAIAGAGDHHAALAWIGQAEKSIPGNVHNHYASAIMEYQDRCVKLHHDLGYVNGTILHHFHGAKKNRRYIERWSIITDNKFDPHVDIVKDWQGVLKLKGNKPKLRDDLRLYFRQRSEDSIDVE